MHMRKGKRSNEYKSNLHGKDIKKKMGSSKLLDKTMDKMQG
jgi:hypothetical protein